MEEQAPFLLLYGYATVSGALGRLAACLAKPCYSSRADENHIAANGPKKDRPEFYERSGDWDSFDVNKYGFPGFVTRISTGGRSLTDPPLSLQRTAMLSAVCRGSGLRWISD
jgi:hypothetical protein